MMKQMSGLVVSSSPLVMLVLIWGGVDAITAIGLQIVFFVMIMSASFISLFITILVGRRYSFDEYERLRPVSNRSAAERPGAIPLHLPESSAELSAPRHTDVESRPTKS
jgi:putative ABC transport system permease protein